MKHTIRHRLILGLLLFVATASIFPPKVFALTGSVYFYPGGNDVINGTEINVEVRGNVPDPGWWGGGATIVVNYDPAKLQLIERSDSGGAFQAANSRNFDGTKAGTVRYTAYVALNAPGVNGNKIINMKFRAISLGGATLSFGSETNVHNGPTTGSPTTFNIIAPTCPAGQVGTPPNCTTPPPPAPSPTPTPTKTPTTKPPVKSTPTPVPTPSPSPTPTVEETPAPVEDSQGGLKIENVHVTTTRQKNSITWTMNRNESMPTLVYGTTKVKQTTEGKVTKLDDGSYEVVLPGLKLGTLYYYTIKASSTNLLEGATYGGTFTTRGYPVQLTIQQNGVLAPGAKVKIGERTFTANKNAIITTELGDGKYGASITPVSTTTTLLVDFTVQKKPVPANGNPELQAFVLNGNVDGASSGSKDNLTLILAALGVLATIGGIFGFLLYRRRNQQSNDPNGVDGDLLIANYGTAIEEPRVNTPEPNLAAATVIPPDATTAAPYQEPYQQDAAYQQESFDATSLPLPPVDPNMATPTISGVTPSLDNSYSEAEQLAPEITQVESIEKAEDPNEPSAIYDASTGELDIIHHNHSEHEMAPLAAPTPDAITPPMPTEQNPSSDSTDTSPSTLTVAH